MRTVETMATVRGDGTLTAKQYLLRVVVNDVVDPAVVVTVYRTSKIAKYWRSE